MTKQKVTKEQIAGAQRYTQLKAVNPFAAAALMNRDGRSICRGLEALRCNEEPEPETTNDNGTNPPPAAA